jgi:Lon-like protease
LNNRSGQAEPAPAVPRFALSVPLAGSRLVFGVEWLLLLPTAIWAGAEWLVPLFAPAFERPLIWLLTLLATLLIVLSLLAHTAVPLLASRLTGAPLPRQVPLFLFGDAAQVWPYAGGAYREAVLALSGPVTSSLIAGIAYLLWELQLNAQLNVVLLLLGLYHGLLAMLNLLPGFPLDGGRLARALMAGLLNQPVRGHWLATIIGYGIGVGISLYASYLLLQNARFSLEVGLGLLALAALLLWPLRRHPSAALATAHSEPAPVPFWRGLLATCLLGGLLAIGASLLPTIHGLYMPGGAVAVSPMIRVPPAQRAQPAGEFYLTTIIAQTPITAGQWFYARLDPAYELVPPERVVPPNQTPQEVMDRAARMLDESETVAKVVALQLAGYNAQVLGVVLEVTAVLPNSPAAAVLQTGDRLLNLNGQRFLSTGDFVRLIAEQPVEQAISIGFERAGVYREETLLLAPPAVAGNPPLLGVVVQSVDVETRLPFAVDIIPQRIVGGPSAGLMFTLTIYNLITPEDLTNGRRIAGTGTIDLSGRVGPIGGVRQKVAAAEAAGASHFLVPPANYADAAAVARRIEVVEVTTAQQAIEYLRALP